jgi:hypothetical protein
MPYTIMEYKTPESIQSEGQQRPPFGPGFSPDQTKIAAKLVVTGSSFSDQGDDWVSFELSDATGKVVAARKIAGY